ncbi:unnamed protein product [Arctia plantaginis]|uniref:Uncharacterized protein n=1 Tax=Arctia plantaginis TaxID=874455 RepID=A0A8S0ZL93_ARCPL|nr:unnamed protein product [Arctia plantaginis]
MEAQQNNVTTNNSDVTMAETANQLVKQITVPSEGVPERSIFKLLEEDPLKHLDYIQTLGVQDKSLMPRLASHASGKAIEIICEKILHKRSNIKEDFLDVFYLFFFPYFLQRKYTWFCLHLLVKASKAHPNRFQTTMKTLLVNTKIQSCILQDYVQRLNEVECAKMLQLYEELYFNAETFAHILPVTYLLCKNGGMTDDTFPLIYSGLNRYRDFCAQNKNYGKLLLFVVQNVHERNVRPKHLKKLIQAHRTIYKSLCRFAFVKFLLKLENQQEEIYFEPLITVPRPLDVLQI